MTGAVASEVSAREGAVAGVQGELTSHKSSYDAYVLSNDAALAQEVVDRGVAVVAEKDRAEAAELVLTNGLSQEVTDRAAGDAGLQAEVDSLQAALSFLTNRFDTLVASL